MGIPVRSEPDRWQIWTQEDDRAGERFLDSAPTLEECYQLIWRDNDLISGKEISSWEDFVEAYPSSQIYNTPLGETEMRRFAVAWVTVGEIRRWWIIYHSGFEPK